MKTLILLRHAKSEEPSFIKKDFNRNLKQKGINDIQKVAKLFEDLNYNPQIVLCSTANRTKETIFEFQKALNVNYNINYLDELYHATASEILSTVQCAESNIQTLMVVGHNFGISQLAYYLGQEACPELPTSGLMVFQFENNIKEGEGKFLHFINPKAF